MYLSNSYLIPLTYCYLQKNKNISFNLLSIFSISCSSLVFYLGSGLAIPLNDIYKFLFWMVVFWAIELSIFIDESLIISSCLTRVVIIFLKTYFSISVSVLCRIYSYFSIWWSRSSSRFLALGSFYYFVWALSLSMTIKLGLARINPLAASLNYS